MEEIRNDRFTAMFGDMESENPPCGLDRKVIARINERVNRRSMRLQWFYMLSLPSLGVAIIIGTLYLISKLTEFDMRIYIPKIEFDPMSFSPFIVPTFCVILLLVADTLIRKRIDKRRSDSK